MSLSLFRSIIYCSTGLIVTGSALQRLPQVANSWSAAIAQPKPTVTQQKFCPLTRSIYRAIGNPTFELIFGASKSGIATEFASLTLKHKTRGNIVAYNLGGSMGYGSLYLTEVGQKTEGDAVEKLKPYFFDSNWKNINGITNLVPRYFFVAGLGVDDWYSNRNGSRTTPLGDVIWQFERCQSR
jgi:hypothetical protein